MIITEQVEYNDSQNTFEGVVAYRKDTNADTPVVLIAHAYSGQSDFEKNKAIELAKLGYIGFAIDLYGKGKRAKTPAQAQELMDHLNSNRTLLLQRMQLSLEQAKKLKFADKTKLGAIGYCFGGKCVLDLARSGEKLKGLVSFHGLYDAPRHNMKTKIKSPILVMHGWNDPLAPPDDVVKLAKELTSKEADWEMTAYGNTGHAFTNPMANSPENGLMYNQNASNKAWNRMKLFFADAFDNG